MDRMDRRHRTLLVLLFALFALGVGLRIHGFSLPLWHEFIDGGAHHEILLGSARDIRSDDWLLDLPLALSQAAQTPRFPEINASIGTGNHMVVPLRVPVNGWIHLFRPSVWGFYWGPDVGVSWIWWVLVLGLFYSSFLVFMKLSRGDFFSSVCLALTLTLSPYFQRWAYHKAELPIHANCAWLAAVGIFSARSPKVRWLWGILFVWSAGGFFLHHVYPPLQVTVGYAYLFLFLGYWVSDLSYGTENRAQKVTAMAVAVISVFLVGGIFFVHYSEVISWIQDTTYPGRRWHMGGGLALAHLFGQNMGHRVSLDLASGNNCEGASFFLFYPIVLAAVWMRRSSFSRTSLWMVGLLGIYLLFNAWYAYIGFPHWLGIASLWGKSLPNRTVLGVGLVNLFLLAWYVRSANHTSLSVYRTGQLALLAALFLIIGFWVYTRAGMKVSVGTWGFAVILNIAAVVLFARARRAFFIFFLLWPFLYDGPVNPLVRGGAAFLHNNALTHKMLTAEKGYSGRATWVVYAAQPRTGAGPAFVLSNFPRMIGIHSIGGYHNHPHHTLWKKLDPRNEQTARWNQCGFLTFAPPRSAQRLEVGGLTGHMDIYLSPFDCAWRDLGVTHFLVTGDDFSIFDTHPGFQRLDSVKASNHTNALYIVRSWEGCLPNSR